MRHRHRCVPWRSVRQRIQKASTLSHSDAHAQEILDAHREALAAAADALMAAETLTGAELEALLAAHPPSRALQPLALSPGSGTGSAAGHGALGHMGNGHGNGVGNGAQAADVRQAQGARAQ